MCSLGKNGRTFNAPFEFGAILLVNHECVVKSLKVSDAGLNVS